MDCLICYDEKTTFTNPCEQCGHVICTQCYTHVSKCPFCRQQLKEEGDIRMSLYDYLLLIHVLGPH